MFKHVDSNNCNSLRERGFEMRDHIEVVHDDVMLIFGPQRFQNQLESG